ncbi:nucleotidyltransferase family protein [Rheinheimera texasensis]|uniref:nucleotidyltransferase family protein n=1 Tax=Rheinheimera texasensis TaxID=306205 RepID=UPI001FE2298C|nr:nucleotidyltransferase domain-containing protein [Rheinheimera texasensis]
MTKAVIQSVDEPAMDPSATPPAGLQLSVGQWQQVHSILQRLLADYPVWAFGSRAEGRGKTYSDLDLVIVSTEPLPLALLAEVSEAFSESDLPWRVDLVDWATTSETFRQRILACKVALQ